MPRYYRRRYTRVVRPKKKWASNIEVWRSQSLSTPFVTTLAVNSVQSGSTPTPSILKVGNFKLTADLVAFYSNAAENKNVVATLYILFVPEGIQDVQIPNLTTQHPEYIMATKVVGGSFSTAATFSLETVNTSTRMKRNLNSGDKVVLYLEFEGVVNPTSVKMTGNVRYWCCSN